MDRLPTRRGDIPAFIYPSQLWLALNLATPSDARLELTSFSWLHIRVI